MHARELTAQIFHSGAYPMLMGLMLESFVNGDLQESLPYLQSDIRLNQWRVANQKTIDILAESATRPVRKEGEASSTIKAESLRTLRSFARIGSGK